MNDSKDFRIQWYPGHMTKARRAMENDVRNVDLVIEVLDARAPMSSRNPDIDRIASGKRRLVVLNKMDLADDSVTKDWIRYFDAQGTKAAAINAKLPNASKTVLQASESVCSDLIRKAREKGFINVKIRALVAGIPNVGKSTVINLLSGKSSAKTGNLPGVTKSNQWIRAGSKMELLDTPGILWPKFDDPSVGMKLAMIGSVSDEVVDTETLAEALIRRIGEEHPEAVVSRYQTDVPDAGAPILPLIAEKKCWLMKGNVPDTGKTAKNILSDFRSGKLGRISLERPELTWENT